MKVFGLVGGVRVYMVVFKARKYGQYHRNQQKTTHHAPAAVAICVDDNHQQIDIGDEAARVSFLPFMILSCTGLDQATISGLSRSSTVLTALHTRLTAFYAKMYTILVCQFYLRNEGFRTCWRCSGVYGCV